MSATIIQFPSKAGPPKPRRRYAHKRRTNNVVPLHPHTVPNTPHSRSAYQLYPNQPEALYNMGYLELENGFAEAAIPLFQRALETNPNFHDAHFNLAMALEQAGNRFRAKYHWQRFLKCAPADEKQWREIARRHLDFTEQSECGR